VENVYEDDFITLLELIDRINQALEVERLTGCLDIGHVKSNSSKTLADWITGLGDRIRYDHLHNNNGFLDDHWRLGKGNINGSEVLHLILKHSPNAVWTVETRVSYIEPSLHWLQNRGYF
jgi:sugar phosphate isomerase/epimerase